MASASLKKYEIPRHRLYVYRVSGFGPELKTERDAAACADAFGGKIARFAQHDRFLLVDELLLCRVLYPAAKDTVFTEFQKDAFLNGHYRGTHYATVWVDIQNGLLYAVISDPAFLPAFLESLRGTLLDARAKIVPVKLYLQSLLCLPRADRVRSMGRNGYRFLELKSILDAGSGWGARRETVDFRERDGFEEADLFEKHPPERIRRARFLSCPHFAKTQRPFVIEVTDVPNVLFASLRGVTLPMLAAIIHRAEVPWGPIMMRGVC